MNYHFSRLAFQDDSITLHFSFVTKLNLQVAETGVGGWKMLCELSNFFCIFLADFIPF